MAVDAKGHSTIAAGEAPTRKAIADGILSINDVIYVANATAQAQLKVALANTAYPIASTRPSTVLRGDAPGLHGIEYSRDGDVWVPASGIPHFANNSARDSWTSANSSLLVAGDHCVSGGLDGVWTGSAWVQDTAWVTPTLSDGWSGYAGETAKYKVRGGVVYIVGRVSGSSGAGATVFTLPAGARPAPGFSTTQPAHSDDGVQIVQVGQDGAVVCASRGGQTRTGLSLAGIAIPIV